MRQRTRRAHQNAAPIQSRHHKPKGLRKLMPRPSRHHGTASHRAYHYLYDDLLN